MPDIVRGRTTTKRTHQHTSHNPDQQPTKNGTALTEQAKWEIESTALDECRRQVRLTHHGKNTRAIFTRNEDPIDAYIYDTLGMLEAMLRQGKITTKWNEENQVYIHTYVFPPTVDRFMPDAIDAQKWALRPGHRQPSRREIERTSRHR